MKLFIILITTNLQQEPLNHEPLFPGEEWGTWVISNISACLPVSTYTTSSTLTYYDEDVA